MRRVGRLDNKSFAVEPVAAADEQGSVNMGDVAANKSFKLDDRGIVEVVPLLLALPLLRLFFFFSFFVVELVAKFMATDSRPFSLLLRVRPVLVAVGEEEEEEAAGFMSTLVPVGGEGGCIIDKLRSALLLLPLPLRADVSVPSSAVIAAEEKVAFAVTVAFSLLLPISLSSSLWNEEEELFCRKRFNFNILLSPLFFLLLLLLCSPRNSLNVKKDDPSIPLIVIVCSIVLLLLCLLAVSFSSWVVVNDDLIILIVMIQFMKRSHGFLLDFTARS